MKAIITAAGLGERMRPLTNNLPKPMLPIGNKPILEYSLNLLKKYGINEVLITTCYLKEKIINYLKDGKKLGMKISYLKEPELIPSARALKQVEDFIDDEVLIIFGDNLTDINLQNFIEFHKKKKTRGFLFVLILKFISQTILHPIQMLKKFSFGFWH